MRARICVVIVCLLAAVLVVPAEAQKKKKAAEAPQTEVQKSTESFRSFLLKYEGLSTNLGKLTKIGTDFVVFENEDGATVMALFGVASIRYVKADEEEGEKEHLVIKLFAMD